jgi:hypothetical protein
LRIRRDLVFLSSLLFTIAFICLIPSQVANAFAGRGDRALLGPGFAEVAKLLGDLGISSLAIILIGLIVTWTGYIKRVRWTWFIMFVIVFAWAFPLMIVPLLHHSVVLTVPEWFSRAMKEPGPARDAAEEVLIFSLMVIALLLPVSSFFRPPAPSAEVIAVLTDTLGKHV